MNSPWRIELFGGLQLLGDGQVINRFQTRKTAALLAYLAFNGDKGTAREVLAEMFWPDNDPEAARNSLRVALNSLRKQLEPPNVPPGAVLTADRAMVRLNPAAFVTDVAEFEEALNREKRAETDLERCQALLQAIALYRGPLLSGWYEDWIDLEQTRLAETYGSALRRLTALLFRAGNYEQALEYGQRAVHADPLREEAHRLLMRLYAATGRPGAAREQYQRLEKVLEDEVGGVPSPATRELLKQIVSAAGLSNGPGDNDDTDDVEFLLTQTRETPTTASASLRGESSAPAGAVAGTGDEVNSSGGVPLQFTRFFGRGAETAEVEALLENEAVRLVTLTGPGGTGKTRLAIEIAARYKTAHQGRAWVASLGELTDGAQVGPALLTALRQTPLPDTSPLEQIAAALGPVPALLVLDNLEQMVEAGAEWAQLLLGGIPSLQILVTSRQRLSLPMEREIKLSPLPVPPAPASAAGPDAAAATATITPQELQNLAAVPSVALFLDRARATRPDFQITPRNAAAITSLCRHLDGLPLALELAAAWVRLLSPAQMLERLTERYDLLTSDRRGAGGGGGGGEHTGGVRQRSLRAVMEESWRLLPEDRQAFAASLSIFRGGWTLEAAQSVCKEADALELLDLLQQQSLVVARTEGGGSGEGMRFFMLEMVRRYAEETLPPEIARNLSRAHREYFARLAAKAGLALSGPKADIWRDRLEADHDNIRAALHATLAVDPVAALTMAANLWRFWYARGHVEEGQRLLERTLQAAPQADPEVRATALHGAGRLALSLGNASLAATRLEQAAAALLTTETTEAASLTAAHRRAMIATDQALAARARGDREGEQNAYRFLTELYREMGDCWAQARTLHTLAGVLAATGDPEGMLRCRAEADRLLEVNEEIAPAEPSIVGALLELGDVATAQGDYAAGLPLLHEALESYRRKDDVTGAARALERIAVAALHQGDWTASRVAAEEALLMLGGENPFLRRVLDTAAVQEQDTYLPAGTTAF